MHKKMTWVNSKFQRVLYNYWNNLLAVLFKKPFQIYPSLLNNEENVDLFNTGRHLVIKTTRTRKSGIQEDRTEIRNPISVVNLGVILPAF